ncbi:methyltransferase domain-containing protein [Falsiroseomonas sp.]|uniref:methyltransferase domain-containing protein n=1 Tax=Falsiroseomonas sp. TaxID=2870721 RepID=UPI003565070E
MGSEPRTGGDLKGQVTRSAAEIYDGFFVPALFRQWAPRMAEAARLAPGERVLDIACGTGVLAREAALRVAPGGAVVGLDRNVDMLAVAERRAPELEWRLGRAEALPFADASFDAAVGQFGLMFFEDRIAALREQWRVLKPGGRLAVAVWGALEQSPGYAAMAALLRDLFGPRIANELRAPFALGDAAALRALFDQAGIPGVEIESVAGEARFPSIQAWVETDVKGWTLAELLDEAQYATLLREAEQRLAGFVQPGTGQVAFGIPAILATATRPA